MTRPFVFLFSLTNEVNAFSSAGFTVHPYCVGKYCASKLRIWKAYELEILSNSWRKLLCDSVDEPVRYCLLGFALNIFSPRWEDVSHREHHQYNFLQWLTFSSTQNGTMGAGVLCHPSGAPCLNSGGSASHQRNAISILVVERLSSSLCRMLNYIKDSF